MARRTGVQLVLKGNFKQIMKNRDKILRTVDWRVAKALDKFGAQTRADARRAIGNPAKQKAKKSLGWVTLQDGRRAERVSKTGWISGKPRSPGKPPRARTSHDFYALRNIRYLPDYVERKVVVGPWFTGTNRGKYGGQTVPQLLEKGGTQKTFAREIIEPGELSRRKGGWVQLRGKSQVIEASPKTKGAYPVTWHVKRRPYMLPAYTRQRKKALAYFKDIFRK